MQGKLEKVLAEAKEQLKNTIRERLKFLDAELGGDSE